MRQSEALLLSELRVATIQGEARRTREESRLSLTELGAACRVAPSTVSRWERGIQSPRGPAGLRYARVLARLRSALDQRAAS